jgi:predicted ATPase
VPALRLSFDKGTGAGNCLQAESFFNTVSHMDRLDGENAPSATINAFYGGRSLRARSHGETFFKLLELKFQRNGLFLLDEPEAALSPQRRLAFSCAAPRRLEEAQRCSIHHLNALAGPARMPEG